MIRYSITRQNLETQIESECPKWLAKATQRTEKFKVLGYYEEDSPIWSDVKIVFMRLQGGCKCAYCERKFESEKYGKIELDVEHFRPKSNVRAWDVPDALKQAGVFATTPPSDNGYYLLPYHPFNYSVACKPCNTILKSDMFPIAGIYRLTGDNPVDLKDEKPLLIYPIGDFDDDPEDLIRFMGPSPYAVMPDGHQHHRALVTIEFFKLDDHNSRKNLFLERIQLIQALFPQLVRLYGIGTEKEKQQARVVVERYTNSEARHANCMRSFNRLYESDPALAQEIYDKTIELFETMS